MFTDTPRSNVSYTITKGDLRKLDAEIQYILSQFEKPKEWADLTNCLIRLNRIIKHSEIPAIPHKETICKRLAQCLNPQLPSGVHIRALEVYGSILEKATPEGLSQDLALFSIGLFPFFTFSAITVRPIFLNLIEQYYIPLGPKLIPCLIGLLICIIPGLEDEKSETFDNVYKTLERISNCVSERFFMRALWLILLKASKIRLPTLYVIANKLSPGVPLLPNDRLEILLPNRNILVVESLKATTEDDSMLLLRELINLLIKHFPFDSNTLSDDAKSDISCECLKLLTKRDWSLTRRLYRWIFNTTDFSSSGETLDLTYFTKYSKNVIISAIKKLLMMRGKTLDDVLAPIKIIVTFISDIDLAGITDELMPVLCIPILQYVCSDSDDSDWRSEIIQETRIIFNPSLTSPNIIFNAMIYEFNNLIESGAFNFSNLWCDLLEWTNVYLDELHTISICETVLCGLFMLLDNSLRNLHRFSVKNDLTLVCNILMYISKILTRVESIINGDTEYFCYTDVTLMDGEVDYVDILVKSQKSCNSQILHYLDSFYTTSLLYFEQQTVPLSTCDTTIIDTLNKLAVRFITIEDFLAVLPLTKVLSAADKPEDSKLLSVATLDDTFYPKKSNSTKLSPSLSHFLSHYSSESTPDNVCHEAFKPETWAACLLKCALSTNPQLFCRGIRTLVELLRLPNNAPLSRYISQNCDHLRNIVLQLWNCLDEKYAASHSEIVLLLIQLNSTVHKSKAETEQVIVSDLTSSDPELRISAILRFGVLWRYSHIHTPGQEIFPEAIGCILDNVEESDPKLHYYSRAFLSESIYMLSYLLDPILGALLSFDNSHYSYGSHICNILRKFRHLSSIVGREGQALLDMMQRRQVPIHLLQLVQGRAMYNELSGSYVNTFKTNKCEDSADHSVTVDSFIQHTDQMSSENSIVFPRLKDPLNLSYTEECIYDYVDLVIIITLKYICLNVDMNALLSLKNLEDLHTYAQSVQRDVHGAEDVMQENSMLFRCTAIDFMKLFLSCIQPTSRAKEAACLISRHLLAVLYHFHLKDEAIIQTQMIYLLKVVMDRCHTETDAVSKALLSLFDMADNLSRHPMDRISSTPKSLDFHLTFSKSDTMLKNDLDSVDAYEDSTKNYINEDPVLDNMLTCGTFHDTDMMVYSKSGIFPNEPSFRATNSRDPFDTKTPMLSPFYIVNVASIKKFHLNNLKKLSDDNLFLPIIDLCIHNTAKLKRPHLLQSYVDFSIYNLKYLTGEMGVKYASSFIRKFCVNLSADKDCIGISGLFHYLRGLYFMINHIAEKVMNETNIIKDMKNTADHICGATLNPSTPVNAEHNNSDAEDGFTWQIFGFGTSGIRQKKRNTNVENKNAALLEISDVVDTCVRSLIWARRSLDTGDSHVKRNNPAYVSTTRELTWLESEDMMSRDEHGIFTQNSAKDATRLDIRMSVDNISKQVARLIRLMYSTIPYHFTKGCLCVWAMAESSAQKYEIKQTIMNLISYIPQFSSSKVLSCTLDMLEQFSKTSQFKEFKGYKFLNCTVRENSFYDFIYSMVTSPIIQEGDVDATYVELQRLVHFALAYPRQPSVFIWIFNIILRFDRIHPCKDANLLGKVGKRAFSDLILVIIYQSVGLYLHKVCSWLQPKLYDLDPPLPLHILLINKYYYNQRTQTLSPESYHSAPSKGRTPSMGSDGLEDENLVLDFSDCTSNNALAHLIFFNYETSQLNKRTIITNIFFQTLYKNLSTYILPTLQDKQDSVMRYRYLTFLFIKCLPFTLYDGSLLCIKKPIIDYINSADFFKTDRRTFRCLIGIFREVADVECKGTTDLMIKLDWYTCPPHSSVFTNRSMNIQSRIKYLKRLAFVIYACRNDTFARHISTIIERLAENSRAYDDTELRAKCLFVMRVLLVKMSQEHLTVLWPVLLSELIKIFDGERKLLLGKDDIPTKGLTSSDLDRRCDSLDDATQTDSKYLLLSEAIKIIDIACTLRLNDFLIYQWMFVNDITERGYSADVTDVPASGFKPFLIVLEQLYPEEIRKELHTSIYRTNSRVNPEAIQKSPESTPSVDGQITVHGDIKDSRLKRDNLVHNAVPSLKNGSLESYFSATQQSLDSQIIKSSFCAHASAKEFERKKLVIHEGKSSVITPTEDIIATLIEDEFLELEPNLIALEPELNLHQIYKICRKANYHSEEMILPY